MLSIDWLFSLEKLITPVYSNFPLFLIMIIILILLFSGSICLSTAEGFSEFKDLNVYFLFIRFQNFQNAQQHPSPKIPVWLVSYQQGLHLKSKFQLKRIAHIPLVLLFLGSFLTHFIIFQFEIPKGFALKVDTTTDYMISPGDMVLFDNFL